MMMLKDGKRDGGREKTLIQMEQDVDTDGTGSDAMSSDLGSLDKRRPLCQHVGW